MNSSGGSFKSGNQNHDGTQRRAAGEPGDACPAPSQPVCAARRAPGRTADWASPSELPAARGSTAGGGSPSDCCCGRTSQLRGPCCYWGQSRVHDAVPLVAPLVHGGGEPLLPARPIARQSARAAIIKIRKRICCSPWLSE